MARSFNGSSDKVNASAIATSAVDNLTMACWVNSSASNLGKFLFYNGGNASGYGFVISNPGGKIAIDMNGITELDSTTALTNGTWTHIAMLRTSGAWTLYVNGVITSLSGNNTPTTPVGFASLANRFNANFWNGNLADAAIWTTPLSAGQVLALANGARPYTLGASTNLVLYWPVDGLQSPEPDLSGNALNGTVTGTALAAGPPVMQFTPRWPQHLAPPSVTFNPAWARGKNIIIEGIAT